MLQTEIVVRCLKCGVKNRIPIGKIQQNASCGSCGASLEEIIISCLHCGKKNRLGEKTLQNLKNMAAPPEDEEKGEAKESREGFKGVPRCGACGKPLLDGDRAAPQA